MLGSEPGDFAGKAGLQASGRTKWRRLRGIQAGFGCRAERTAFRCCSVLSGGCQRNRTNCNPNGARSAAIARAFTSWLRQTGALISPLPKNGEGAVGKKMFDAE